MKDVRRLYFVWVAALLVAVPEVSLRGHDVPPEVLAYVKAEGARLRVLVRVPVTFLPDARLPVRGDGYLDVDALDAGPAILSAVASEVSRNLDLMEDDRPLASRRTTWKIARSPDASFESYDEALTHLVSPGPAADSRIDPGAVLVDLELEYPIASPDGRFSLRANGLRLANRASRMRTRYVTPDGELRTFLTSGLPQRIDLEPRWQSVGALFARLGVEQFTVTGLHLIFILCLAIPRRSWRDTLAAFGAFAAGCGFAIALSAFVSGGQDSSRSFALFSSCAGAALVVAALQNIAAPRFVWVRASAAAFGVFDGLLVGLVYRQNAQFAGLHETIAIVSFAAPVLLGSLWALLLARPIVGLIYRSTLPERWALVCLSAIPIHAGLHGLLVGQ